MTEHMFSCYFIKSAFISTLPLVQIPLFSGYEKEWKNKTYLQLSGLEEGNLCQSNTNMAHVQYSMFGQLNAGAHSQIHRQFPMYK